MRLIKISPKYQITIPSVYRRYLKTEWLSVTHNGSVFTMRSIEIKEAQTDDEIMNDIFNQNPKPKSTFIRIFEKISKIWSKEDDSLF